MTRGKQKIEAQKKNAEKNSKNKGSQIEARAVGLKVTCPVCKTSGIGWMQSGIGKLYSTTILRRLYQGMHQVQLANEKQLTDHYGSKHPKEIPPSNSG